MDAFVDIKKQGISAFTPFANIVPQVINASGDIPALHNADSTGVITIGDSATITVGISSVWRISENQSYLTFAKVHAQMAIVDSEIPYLHNALSVGDIRIESGVTISIFTDSLWRII